MKKKKKPKDFAAPEKHLFDGIHLQPWTEARRVAAQTLGLIYPNLNKSDWASLKRGGDYPGAVRDTMLALWLCTITSSELIKIEMAGIENAMEESMKFGIEHGISDRRKQKFWDAFSKCMDIWNEVSDSVTVPEKSDSGDDEGND